MMCMLLRITGTILPLLLFLLSSMAGAQSVEVRKHYDLEQLHIKEIYYVADSAQGKLNGPYTSYYYSGGIESEGNYEDNTPTGQWQYFFENGKRKMSGAIVDGESTGRWEYFFENGKMRMAGILRDNKRQGEWVYYFENGEVKSKGNFVDNLPDGIWNYFYEDGTLKAQAFYTEGRGKYKEFYHSGRLKAEGLNVDSKSDSTWTFYYETGRMKARGEYINGQKEGVWKYYHPNGTLSAEGNFADGEKVGSWEYFHENGLLASVGIEKEGQKEGYWKLYYDTGELFGEGTYEQGSGQYKEFYENGKIKTEGQFKKGARHGKWYYYYEDGSLEGFCLFENGSGKYTGYYDDGSLKMEGNIKHEKKVGRWKLFNKDGSLAGYYNPIYEDEAPVFKVDETLVKETERRNYDKPEFLFRSKQIRYFTPRVNEYRGVILASNPALSLLGSLPVGLEYYYQERLGYELYFQYLQKPFYKSGNRVSPGELYRQGFSLALRQKFYEEHARYSMFYFGHQISYTNLSHLVNQTDPNNPAALLTYNTRESRMEYGLFAGTRLLRDAGNGGLTVDIFAGGSIGYRDFRKNFTPDPTISALFDELEQESVSVQFIFGANIGIMGPPKKSSTIK